MRVNITFFHTLRRAQIATKYFNFTNLLPFHEFSRIFLLLFAVTSRSCSRAPAVNPDCSYHLVNILRATVCICDQPLCNGVNAFVNYTNTISRVFSNQNKLLLTNNHIRLTSSADSHKEDFMPLHDFDEQRIAAMLGTHNSANYRHWNYESLILLILCLLLF